MQCPLYKRLKNNGTSFFAFPGASEDISASYQNENYKMYFSKYVLLNFPKENLINLGGTQSSKTLFDFDTFSTVAPVLAGDYKDRVIESLRNYVANHEVVLRESRLNNTEYYYDNTELQTTTEKIFWKWCKKLNLIDFELAVPQDEYFDNLEEFSRINLNDDSYFPEYLWKEREVKQWDVVDYYESNSLVGKLELLTGGITNLRKGDIITLSNFSSALASVIWGGTEWLGDVTVEILDVITQTNNQKIIVDYDSTINGSPNVNVGAISLVYNRLVQYIGEVNGISNVQEANKAYTEVYAHIPDHTGKTPDVLFRIVADNNYKPGLEFPILPSQYQPEIFGAENFQSPIVSNPIAYPGSYYGQFDTPDFVYECESGDTLRRSGRYYGVTGDINEPIVDGASIDGLTLDFNTDHYVKMNLFDREVATFDQFNALDINNTPPEDFEFNAILWYYTVEDLAGNIRTNLYGISFLDNPDNNSNPDEVSLRFPVYKKLVTNGEQDGTSYAFGLNLNFNIINDNPQDPYNPEAINSLFSMNLFNEAMRRLSSVNDSFLNILTEQTSLKDEIMNIKQLLYSQTDISVINERINNLDNLLNLYSTQQIVSSETIEVVLNEGFPTQLELRSIDKNYFSIREITTLNMFNNQGSIPVSIVPDTNKNFLLKIVNNDNVPLSLPSNDKLSLVITQDLSYKQKMDIIITGSELSSQNKKLDIFIQTINPISGTNSLITDEFDLVNETLVTPPIETLLIGDIDLPVFYNLNTSSQNSAFTWKGFNFDIDFNQTIRIVSGNILEVRLSDNPLIVTNSIKPGDTFILNNLFLGTSSVFDFSGQYRVSNVEGNLISIDVSNNSNLLNYVNGNFPFIIHTTSSSLLSNKPYFSLNKGYMISLTRTSERDDLNVLDKYFLEIKELL